MNALLRLFRRNTNPPDGAGPLYSQVREVMRDVQAYARSHGGDIELVSVSEEGDVEIRFRGACAHCPLSELTMKQGVEERLRELVPGVQSIVQA